MKLFFARVGLICVAFLVGGCSGPVVTSIKTSAAPALSTAHPSVLYALKRTRLNLQFDIHLLQVMTEKKVGDEWQPERSRVSYRLDFSRPETAKVTPTYEDDPNLVFAIETDSIESSVTDIKNFEIKFATDGSLQSVNGQFEDNTITIASNVVSLGVDLAKFAGNVALAAATAPVPKSGDVARTTVVSLATPVVKGNVSVLVTALAAKNFEIDLLDIVKGYLAVALTEIEKRHANENETLRAGLRTKLKEGKSKADQAAVDNLNDSDLADAGGVSQTYFYPEKPILDNLPTALKLKVSGEGADLTEGCGQTAMAIVAAVAKARQGADTTAAASSSVEGIFYRKPGSGHASLEATVTTGDGPATILLTEVFLSLPEAGQIAYTNVDSRWFSNRNVTVTFGGMSELNGYKLAANSAAQALSDALSKKGKDVLTALEEIKDQKKKEAKNDRQDVANQQLRVIAQQDLIFTKEQAIADQERVVARKKVLVQDAKADFKESDLVLDREVDGNADKIAAAKTARDRLQDAHDTLAKEQANLDRLRHEKDVLEAKLEILKSGSTITPAPST